MACGRPSIRSFSPELTGRAGPVGAFDMARKLSRSARRSAGQLMLAPAVMAMRMPLLMAEAQSHTSARTETLLASSEKAKAFAEGMAAAQSSLVGSMFSFWPELMAGRTPSLMSGKAMEQAMDAAMVPSGKAVRANYRRLGRSK